MVLPETIDGKTPKISEVITHAHGGGMAACTERAKCVYCGTEYGEPAGHSWNDGEVTKAPTCTEKGVKTFTCKRGNCGETKTEEIPATGSSGGSSGPVFSGSPGTTLPPSHIETSTTVVPAPVESSTPSGTSSPSGAPVSSGTFETASPQSDIDPAETVAPAPVQSESAKSATTPPESSPTVTAEAIERDENPGTGVPVNAAMIFGFLAAGGICATLTKCGKRRAYAWQNDYT